MSRACIAVLGCAWLRLARSLRSSRVSSRAKTLYTHRSRVLWPHAHVRNSFAEPALWIVSHTHTSVHTSPCTPPRTQVVKKLLAEKDPLLSFDRYDAFLAENGGCVRRSAVRLARGASTFAGCSP